MIYSILPLIKHVVGNGENYSPGRDGGLTGGRVVSDNERARCGFTNEKQIHTDAHTPKIITTIDPQRSFLPCLFSYFQNNGVAAATI